MTTEEGSSGPAEWNHRVEASSTGARGRLTFFGEVRLSDAPVVHACATALAARCTDIEIDATHAEHLHVTTVQILQAIFRRVDRGRGTCVLVAASEPARSSFQLAGLQPWHEER